MVTATIIRAIGYVVYFLLWSPIVVTSFLIMLIVYIYIGKKDYGLTIRESLEAYTEALRDGFKHDIDFVLGKSDW